MRHCVKCGRLLTIDELMHLLQGQCWSCHDAPYLATASRWLTEDDAAAWWRSDEAMQCD